MAGTGGDAGAGKMMATLVFVGGFLIVVLFLLSSFAPILQTGNYTNTSDMAALGFSAGDMTEYRFFNTTFGPAYFDVTASKYCAYISVPSVWIGIDPIVTGGWSNMTFDTDGADVDFYPLYRHDILMGDKNEFIFFAHYGLWDAKTIIVSIDDVLAKIKASGTAMAMTHRADIVVSFDRTYTLFFIFPAGVDPEAAMEARSGFKVALGQTMDQAYADMGKDAWSYIIGIMTFNIPGGGTGVGEFDLMISVVIYAAILFIAYWAITRLIGALMI
jgi:hypothetical protein